MFELFKMLEAAEHIHEAIVIGDIISFSHNDKKVTLIPSGVEGIYDVLEDGKFIQAMTANEMRVYFGIQ